MAGHKSIRIRTKISLKDWKCLLRQKLQHLHREVLMLDLNLRDSKAQWKHHWTRQA